MGEGPSRRILIVGGESGARVERVRANGREWIQKSGASDALRMEAAVMRWCRGRLPVAEVYEEIYDGEEGRLVVSALPGVTLAEVSLEEAVAGVVWALSLIHALPAEGCPFWASWATRLEQAAGRVEAGEVDESDFDEENAGRSAAEVLEELRLFRKPPPGVLRFVHGDACLPNFLMNGGELTGIVDLGRAGVGHPAQDWALALRSVGSQFGAKGEAMLRRSLPESCHGEELLRGYRLMDELF